MGFPVMMGWTFKSDPYPSMCTCRMEPIKTTAFSRRILIEQAKDPYHMEVASAVGKPGSVYLFVSNEVLFRQSWIEGTLKRYYQRHYANLYITWCTILSLQVNGRETTLWYIATWALLASFDQQCVHRSGWLWVFAQQKERESVSKSSHISLQLLDLSRFFQWTF